MGNPLFWGLVTLLIVAGAWGVRALSGDDADDHPSKTAVTTTTAEKSAEPTAAPVAEAKPSSARKIRIGTYLGNERHDYYGEGPVPRRLSVKWKLKIGSGKTIALNGDHVWWSGTGWTGQPTLVEEKSKDYLLIGGFDHGLRKVDAKTGKVKWRSEFDDVIKGTNTVFENPKKPGELIVASGSRRGYPYDTSDSRIAPLRAVSYRTGKELWRLPVPKTANYSRDVDASPLLWNGLLYAPVESGYFYALDVNKTKSWKGHRKPVARYTSKRLYTKKDVKRHKDNLVIEGSPGIIGDRVYVSTGAGHVWGLDKKLDVVWDFYTGSDIDGTVVVNRDDKILMTIEKQYIDGHGGVYMLDPSKDPDHAAVWYFPTENRGLAEWEGGCVGSVAINDSYNKDGSRPALAAFTSVDGNLYVVSQDKMAGTTKGPNNERGLKKPKLVYKDPIGGSIGTPIIVDDSIIAAGYDRKVHLYKILYDEKASGGTTLPTPSGDSRKVRIKEVDSFRGGAAFEATPIVWKDRVYIGCRDGYLYCLGD